MNFVIPGFYEKRYLNMALILLMKDKPQYFVQDAHVGAVYDTFHISAWDKRTDFSRLNQASFEDMEKIRNFYEEYDVPVRFTFTNPDIKESDLNDTFCNLSLELFDNGRSEVFVVSPLLREYIQSTYPHYYIVPDAHREKIPDELILKGRGATDKATISVYSEYLVQPRYHERFISGLFKIREILMK